MSRNSVKYFVSEDGKMDEIIRVLEEEKGVGRRDNDKTYHFDVCTFRVNQNNEFEVEGKRDVTILYCVAQLEKKASTKLKEIKLEEIIKNGD